MKKTIFMATTEISAETSIAQIEKLLSRAGASSVLKHYEKGEPAALAFQVQVQGKPLPFLLPCRWQKVHAALYNGKNEAYTDQGIDRRVAQAKRVAWRQILRWVEAQLALIETGMVKVQEVFLPYIQAPDGKTIYEVVEDRGYKLLTCTET